MLIPKSAVSKALHLEYYVHNPLINHEMHGFNGRSDMMLRWSNLILSMWGKGKESIIIFCTKERPASCTVLFTSLHTFLVGSKQALAVACQSVS